MTASKRPRKAKGAPKTIDWKNIDYDRVIQERAERLQRLRENPSMLPALCAHYAGHPAAFIDDWGVTQDPRRQPASLPFILWPKQREWIEWVDGLRKGSQSGLTEKSRDSGVTNLAVAYAAWLCLFHRGMVVGFGSRKEEYVDKLGVPKSILEKARFFLSHLPPEFLGGWVREKHAPHMRIMFPATGSTITGEAGDQIGRGDRATLYFVDEAAFLERPELVDASLSATTNCRIDISTPNGRDNPFALKRFSGTWPVFTFHWRDDPRKDDAWYQKQKALLDPVTLAQEVDIDYSASKEGILIPQAWARAAVGAAAKLGIEITGMRRGALDVADQGTDRNCFAGRHGIELKHLQSWSGAGSDIFNSVITACMHCDRGAYRELLYDADGLGAGVRGDVAQINIQRKGVGLHAIGDRSFRGSAAPSDPDGEMMPGRTNADYFLNLKAQSWMALRQRFRNTHRAVVEGHPVESPDTLISIDPNLPELEELLAELSMPTYGVNATGKVFVDKLAGGKSPNRADAVMMVFAPLDGEGGFFDDLLTSGTAAEPPVPVAALPDLVTAVYASATVAVEPDKDALCVVYVGYTETNSTNAPIVILDWEIEHLSAGAVVREWAPKVLTRARELAVECRSLLGSAGVIIDAAGMGIACWQDAQARGIGRVVFSREEVQALDPNERGVAAAGQVQLGKVKLSRTALEKTVTFKQTTRNWLLPLVQFGVRQDLSSAGPLFLAFANSVLEVLISNAAPPRRKSA